MNLPILSPNQVIKSLEKLGFVYVSQKGSHRKYRKEGRSVIIPMHKELARGTLRSILEQAGIGIDELLVEL